MTLKEKFALQIAEASGRKTWCAVVNSKTLLQLMLECGFDPPKPPQPLPDALCFMGQKLTVNDRVPDGELRLSFWSVDLGVDSTPKIVR